MKKEGRRVCVVFDIDGTLTDSDDFDGRCYVAAVKEVLGDVTIDGDWRNYRYATDAGILRQILEVNGFGFQPALIKRVREAFGAGVKRYFDAGGACRPVPGAIAALAGLSARGFRIGLATGGWGHTARLKLDRAGIERDGLPLTSSDESYDRGEIMERCLTLLGGDSGQAIYVGNGEWDRDTSERAGWAFIGVGPKIKNRCDIWVSDYLDPAWRDAPRRALERRAAKSSPR